MTDVLPLQEDQAGMVKAFRKVVADHGMASEKNDSSIDEKMARTLLSGLLKDIAVSDDGNNIVLKSQYPSINIRDSKSWHNEAVREFRYNKATLERSSLDDIEVDYRDYADAIQTEYRRALLRHLSSLGISGAKCDDGHFGEVKISIPAEHVSKIEKMLEREMQEKLTFVMKSSGANHRDLKNMTRTLG